MILYHNKEPNFIKKPNKKKIPRQRPWKKATFLQFGFKKVNMATLLKKESRDKRAKQTIHALVTWKETNQETKQPLPAHDFDQLVDEITGTSV